MTFEGETGTGSSGPRTGRSLVTSRSAHQDAGSAPRTPSRAAAASRCSAGSATPGSGLDGLAAQLAHEPGQRHRARDLGVRPHLVGEPGRRRRVDEVEIDGGLLVLVADRGDEEALGGPGDGDEEEARLVVADGRLRGTEAEWSLRHDVDEVLGAEDRAAQPQVGPDALLHPGDDDDPPLAARRGLRGQQRDPAAGLAADEQRVAGHVLALDVLEELVGPGRGQPVDEGSGSIEEREHGVEVAVGALARRATREGLTTPPLGDASALPDRPEHGLGGHPRCPAPVVPDARGGRPGGQCCADALRRPTARAEQTRARRELEQLGEQLVARSPTAGGQLILAKHPPQPAQPHGVGPADR